MNPPICRCGYTGEGPHQCHVGREIPGRRCPNPGVEQLVVYPTCIAGVQMKLGAVSGCYCERHWEEWGRGEAEPSDHTP